MGRYIFRRVLQAIPLLLLVSIFMFTLVHLLPGGPERVLLNPRMSPTAQAALRERLGLNYPVPVQYFKWLGSMLVGDFGFSFDTNQSVSSVLADHFPNTLQLFLLGLLLALIVALFIGSLSALRYRTTVDYILTTVAYFGISMPIFVFALLAQDIFGVKLHALPVSGMITAGYVFDPFNSFIDRATHLILPTIVLSITFIAGWSRFLRSSMVEVIKQDYMRTARAKGVGPFAWVARHALRNAVIPLITVVAIDFGSVAGGAAITEGIFSWPGMGKLFIDSLERLDYPVLLAMLLLSAVFVIAFNLLADILYAVMDPRIRYS